jgi:hypothetical protein
VNSQLSTLSIMSAPSFICGQSPVDHLLAVSEQKKSGLILCKEHHAEFAGPGAAVATSVEQPYKAVIAIGCPELLPINSQNDRRKAYGLRIQWGRWLYRITDHPDPATRVERLFAGFEGFFGRHVVLSIPTEVLASLVGVFPSTVVAVRQRYYGQLDQPDKTAFLFMPDQLKVTTISMGAAAATIQGITETPLRTAATMSEIKRTYAQLRSA